MKKYFGLLLIFFYLNCLFYCISLNFCWVGDDIVLNQTKTNTPNSSSSLDMCKVKSKLPGNDCNEHCISCHVNSNSFIFLRKASFDFKILEWTKSITTIAPLNWRAFFVFIKLEIRNILFLSLTKIDELKFAFCSSHIVNLRI